MTKGLLSSSAHLCTRCGHTCMSYEEEDTCILARTNPQAVLRSYVPSQQKLSMLVDLLGMTLGEFQNLIDSCALGAFSAVVRKVSKET